MTEEPKSAEELAGDLGAVFAPGLTEYATGESWRPECPFCGPECTCATDSKREHLRKVFALHGKEFRPEDWGV